MRAPYYRLTIATCVLCWSMVVLHLPSVIHQWTEHGGHPAWSVLGILTLFGIAGTIALWLLLRSRAS